MVVSAADKLGEDVTSDLRPEDVTGCRGYD
jgi:hypothetical protein